MSQLIAERLQYASKKGVVITIVFGKCEMKDDQLEILGKIKNIEIVYVDNLHAKCYYNESKMIITSMNLHSFSETNNREMGVLIDKINDTQLYDKAKEEAMSIKESGNRGSIEKVSQPRQIPRYDHNLRTSSNMGTCLRCGDDIKFNPAKPLCSDCYELWNIHGNDDYPEHFCHSCGSHADTSMERPLCYQCYKDSQRRRG